MDKRAHIDAYHHCLRTSDYAAGAAHLRAALNEDWDEQVAYALSVCLVNLSGEASAARDLVERLVSDHPANDKYQLLLADVRTEEGDFKQAESIYRSFPDSERWVVHLATSRAVLALRKRKISEAIRQYKIAIEHSTEDELPDLYHGLGRAYLAGSDLQKAEQFLARGLSMAPDNVLLLTARGWLLSKQNRREEAWLDLTRANELAPEHTSVILITCDVLIGEERFEEATAKLEHFHEFFPDRRYASIVAAAKFMRMRYFRRAADLCREAIELDPQNIPAHRILAKALLKTYRWREAWPVFRRYVTLPSEDPKRPFERCEAHL